jgi:hypothetical protein
MQTLSKKCRPKFTRRALRAALPLIEKKLYRGCEPFGVFIMRDGVQVIRASTALFAQRNRRAAVYGDLVGVYDMRACIDWVKDDLEYFCANRRSRKNSLPFARRG